MPKKHFQYVLKTHIESWPAHLHNESIATTMVQLTEEERDSLIETNIMTVEGNWQAPPKKAVVIVDRLADKVTKYIHDYFPTGAFIKLGSRSPKDSWIGYDIGFCCQDGQKAMLLLNDSERISDDLHIAKYNDYLPYIVIREWVKMPAWAEFRGFVRNRKLVGLSQYNYLKEKSYPEIVKNADSIKRAIKQKVENIADLLPAPDIIADFLFTSENVILIELNPFDILTDPCLFDWKKDNFEKFQFRYVKNDSAKQAI